MKVLLLGATGTLGSRIVPALLAHKHQVIIYVRSESKARDVLPSSLLSEVTIVTGDATDSTAINLALTEHKCSALINSAGLASIFPWQAPQMQAIVNAVATAGVEASKTLGQPIRAWFLGGMSALDTPGTNGTMLVKYFPMFTEHALTYKCLSAKPQQNLAWSLLCPSVMKPIASPNESRSNPLIASADVPPSWQDSYFRSVPFLGLLLSILGNAGKYTITLEDCADFLAADLEKVDDQFVGHRVGLYDPGKGKVE